MHTVPRGPSGAMRQLYPTEEGVQLFPSGSTTATGHETKVGVALVGWTEDSFCFIISRDANRLAIRRPWTAIPAHDDAIDPEHGAANEAAGI